MKKLTITEIKNGLEKKKFSAVEVAERYFKEIEKKEKELKVFLSLSRDLALKQAENIDLLISRGDEMPLLAGVPIAIKDNIAVKGLPLTAGSKILEDYKAVYDAFVIEKLREAGAVFLGKTNLDEFAMGSSTENSAFQKTKNPCDLTCVPGGSSGGSAAAVAGGEACVALGSDTGGSIRQPASFCGIVGFKPTYGAVSRFGLVAFASSLDQIGPLAGNVQDAETLFRAIEGIDKNDSTTIEVFKNSQISPKKSLKGITVGIPKEYFAAGVDSNVKKIVWEAVRKAEKSGVKLMDISLPHTKYAIPCYYIVSTAEASANLARYDGIRYGFSEAKGNLEEIYRQSRGKGFGAEVKRRIMLGTYALSSGYYDAYYLKAQKVRELIKQDFIKAFRQVDIIFAPTTPSLAFKIGEKIKNPLEMYMSDALTAPVNLAGLPALSMPVGSVGGLPAGLQIIGSARSDYFVFQIAKNLEKIIL